MEYGLFFSYILSLSRSRKLSSYSHKLVTVVVYYLFFFGYFRAFQCFPDLAAKYFCVCRDIFWIPCPAWSAEIALLVSIWFVCWLPIWNHWKSISSLAEIVANCRSPGPALLWTPNEAALPSWTKIDKRCRVLRYGYVGRTYIFVVRLFLRPRRDRRTSNPDCPFLWPGYYPHPAADRLPSGQISQHSVKMTLIIISGGQTGVWYILYEYLLSL